MFRKLLDAQSKALVVDHKVLSGDQTVRLHRIEQRDVPGRIARGKVQVTETINSTWLLRTRHQRPTGRATDQCDEFPPPHGSALARATDYQGEMRCASKQN